MLVVYKIAKDSQRSRLFTVCSNIRTWGHQMKIASSKQIKGCVIDMVPWWNSLLQCVGVISMYLGRADKLMKTKSKEDY